MMILRRIFHQAIRLPFLPVLLAPFVLLSPVFLTGQTMFWGTPALQFVPWWHWAWETLRAGHLPLWNPLVGMGAPLLANYQSALFYPPTWIYFLLDAIGGVGLLAWGQAILVAFHLVWAGTGMVLLVRRLELGVLSQTLSGLAFSLSGYLVARAGFLSINAAVAWVPWIILGVTPHLSQGAQATQPGKQGQLWSTLQPDFASGGTVKFCGLVLCLAMQLLAGHAQTSWYTWLLAGAWAGFWGWYRFSAVSQVGWRERFVLHLRGLLAGWLRLGLALILAAALAAVQLLPTAEYLLQSQRSSAVDPSFAMEYSAWSWRFLSLLAPDLFGNPVHGDFWGYANYWEDALYIGLLPLLLAMVGSVKGFKRKPVKSSVSRIEEIQPASRTSNPRPESRQDSGRSASVSRTALTRFLLLLILLSVLLALGRNTPVFPWLYHHIPTFSMFQAPARWLLWAEFSLVLLAGIGASGWARPEGQALYWTRLGTAGAFAVSLGAGLAWYLMGDISPTFISATALAGVWGLGAGALSLVAPPAHAAKNTERRGRDHLWQWGVALFVAADLLVAGWGLNPGTGAQLYTRASPLADQVRATDGDGRIYLPASDERELKFERFLRFDTFDPGEDWFNMRAVLLPNMNMLDGIHSANNFDPLVPGRYARWMDALAEATPETSGSILSLMGVGVVEKVDTQTAYGVRLEPTGKDGGGRLRWVPCARFASDAQDAWQQVWEGEVDFQTQVVLESQNPAGFPGNSTCQNAAANASIRVGADTPNRLSFQLSSASAGWLVLSDVWYPGWKAWIDGKPVPVFKADYLFRAVYVGAGEHQVVFAYQPLSFWLGLGISLVAGLALAGYTLMVVFGQIGAGRVPNSTKG